MNIASIGAVVRELSFFCGLKSIEVSDVIRIQSSGCGDGTFHRIIRCRTHPSILLAFFVDCRWRRSLLLRRRKLFHLVARGARVVASPPLSQDRRWNPVHVPSVPPLHLFPRSWFRKRDELDGPNRCHSHVLPETPHRPLPRGRQTVVLTTVPCHVASGGGGSCGWDGFLACTRGRRRARARARGKEPCNSAARWASVLQTFPIQPPRASTRAQSGNRTVRANVDSWWMPRSKMDK